MYVYIVLVLALIAVGFFVFIFSTALQAVQTSFNPMLESGSWIDTQHYDAFVLAATFVNNLWIALPVLLVLGLLYWSWVYIQRKNAGGA